MGGKGRQLVVGASEWLIAMVSLFCLFWSERALVDNGERTIAFRRESSEPSKRVRGFVVAYGLGSMKVTGLVECRDAL